jgi:hypothetical protein
MLVRLISIVFSRTKSILQPPDFMNMCRSPDSWQEWMVNLVIRKPVSWTFDKMKNMVFSTTIGPQTQFVHLAAIKARKVT